MLNPCGLKCSDWSGSKWSHLTWDRKWVLKWYLYKEIIIYSKIFKTGHRILKYATKKNNTSLQCEIDEPADIVEQLGRVCCLLFVCWLCQRESLFCELLSVSIMTNIFFLILYIKNGDLARYSFYWLEDKESDVMYIQCTRSWILVFLENTHILCDNLWELRFYFCLYNFGSQCL